MLGEKSTTEITKTNDTHGFNNLKKDAMEGGKIAGDAKKALEKKTGRPVSTPENYLTEPENRKKLKGEAD